MGYNERLMNESLKGDDDSLNELKFNAGSGNCEAQYYLAMFYARACGHLHDHNYHYWLEKSKDNGYVPGVGKPKQSDGSNTSYVLTMNDINLFSHLITLLSLI